MFASQPHWADVVPFPATILLRMPDDGYRYELYKGLLVREAMTAPKHGGICHKLSGVFFQYAMTHTLEHAVVQNTLFDLTLAGDQQRTVFATDLAIMWGATAGTSIPQESPLIAIEVVSPSQSLADLQEKRGVYLQAGTAEVWIIDPQGQQAEIATATEVRLLVPPAALTSALLPDFTVDLNWLIA